jgi:hypothetical protein
VILVCDYKVIMGSDILISSQIFIFGYSGSCLMLSWFVIIRLMGSDI